MTHRSAWVLVVYAVPTVGLLVQGLLYLTTSTFMPYHAAALDITWDELPPHYQGFILGVLKAMGAGSFVVSLSLLLMLAGPFRSGNPWAYWTVPLIGTLFSLLTAYAAYTIDVLTPASTPWRQTCGLAATYVAGVIITFWPSTRQNEDPAARKYQ